MHKILLSFILLFALSKSYAQMNQDLLKYDSFERVRILNELLEEGSSDNLDTLKLFLHEVGVFAKDNNDKVLAKEVDFLMETISVMKEKNWSIRLAFLENRVKNKYPKESYYYARCLHQIGQTHFVLKNYSLAFENMTRARNIFKKIGYDNVPVIGKFFHALALDYYYFRNYNEAIEVMLESIKLPPYSENLDLQRYNTTGMSYVKMKEFDKAYFYFKEALTKAKTYKNKTWEGLISGNIGNLLLSKGDNKAALPYLQLDYNISIKENQHPEIMQNAASNLAEVYIKLDSLEKAKYYIHKTKIFLVKKDSLEFGEQQQYEVGKMKYFNNQYLLNLKEQKFEIALKYLDTLRKTEALENDMYNSTLAKFVEGNVEIQEKQKRIQLQEKQQEELKLRYSIYILVLVLACIIGYFLFYVNMMRKRSLKNEHKITELENQKIKSDLQASKNVIESFVKKINEKNQLIEKVTLAIKNLEEQHSIKEIELENTLRELRTTKILTDTDWTDFQINFDKNYPYFSAKVRELYPQITSSELRYLMLSKINLDHKQMANALGVSTDAIRVTWNRVKKKTQSSINQTPDLLIKEIDSKINL